MSDEAKTLKRAVIKEELVALTGDYVLALILNQFLYWTERINDHDLFLEEEIIRAANDGISLDIQASHGWIYKKAEELSDELMIGASPATIGRRIKELLEKGYLEQRTNPKFKWDRTLQYRVNLIKVQMDLLKLGYALEGYKLPPLPIFQNESSILHQDSITETPNFQNEKSSFHGESSTFQNESSNLQFEKAIPEITTENLLTDKKEDANQAVDNFRPDIEPCSVDNLPPSILKLCTEPIDEDNPIYKINKHWRIAFRRDILPPERDEIYTFIDKGLPINVIILAIEEAVRNNRIALNYISAVLTDWLKGGLRTVESVKDAQEKYKERKGVGNNGTRKAKQSRNGSTLGGSKTEIPGKEGTKKDRGWI